MTDWVGEKERKAKGETNPRRLKALKPKRLGDEQKEVKRGSSEWLIESLASDMLTW